MRERPLCCPRAEVIAKADHKDGGFPAVVRKGGKGYMGVSASAEVGDSGVPIDLGSSNECGGAVDCLTLAVSGTVESCLSHVPGSWLSKAIFAWLPGFGGVAMLKAHAC